MNRRGFIASGVAVTGTLSLAGCTDSSPPPRRSEVFGDVTATGESVALTIADQPVIESRADVQAQEASNPPGGLVGLLASLNPVGVAAAAKGGGGRGATGRGDGGYSSAPKNHHGHAKYHGGDYDDWREDHRDEVENYRAEVDVLAVGYIGTNAQMEESPPGPGAIDWDKTWQDPEPGEEITYQPPQAGWYRTGTKLEAQGANHSFGWECLDFRVEGQGDSIRLDEIWKVSPRL